MNIKKWLTVKSNESARLTQGKPVVGVDEVSILLDINLPDELFRRPRLEAKIEIPQEAAGPETISSEVIENVQEAIQKSTGLTFSINVVNNVEKEERAREGRPSEQGHETQS